jgi:hypothetical protein
MTILASSRSRKLLHFIAFTALFKEQKSRWEEKKVIECTRSSFVLGRSGTGYVGPHSRDLVPLTSLRHGRKTTVIIFKIFGIERAWQKQGCVGPRPRQLFVTKSRLLSEKVERDYVSLLHSLSAGPEPPQYVRERIQSWNLRRKEIFNSDDVEGKRDDLPEKYSLLRDEHFPLFLTMDTVSTTLTIRIFGTDSDCIFIYSCAAFWRLI